MDPAGRADATPAGHLDAGSHHRQVPPPGAPIPPSPQSRQALDALTRPGREERTSEDPIVAAAVRNVHRNIASLSASEVVQLVLYPEPLVAWATGAGVDDSQVANLFRHHRRYNRIRSLLAARLGVPIAILDHLIDATPAVPAAKRPAAYATILDDAGLGDWARHKPIDWGSPPYPLSRDGTNPLERFAIAVVSAAAPSMPASRIVGYAMWPETLAAFAERAQRFTLDQLLTTLSGLRRSDAIEVALARRLRVPHRTLDAFIRATKRDPFADAAEAVASPGSLERHKAGNRL